MPFYLFMWTDEIEEHLAEHDVTAADFETIVCDPDRTEISRSSGRPMAMGYAADGRYLGCVYELEDDGVTVIPYTAFEI